MGRRFLNPVHFFHVWPQGGSKPLSDTVFSSHYRRHSHDKSLILLYPMMSKDFSESKMYFM